MTSSQIRAEARSNLEGKWGKAALLSLSFALIYSIGSMLLCFIPILGALACTLIGLPLTFGFISSIMKLKNNEDVSYTDFINVGFSNFGKIWGIIGHIILKLIIPLILVIVAGFVISLGGSLGFVGVFSDTASLAGSGALMLLLGSLFSLIASIYLALKTLYYQLVPFVLFDNLDMSSKEIVEKSGSLMKGHRWKFVWLQLTFIGWTILAGISLGIGFFWLVPYVITSSINFYEDVNNTTIEE